MGCSLSALLTLRAKGLGLLSPDEPLSAKSNRHPALCKDHKLRRTISVNASVTATAFPPPDPSGNLHVAVNNVIVAGKSQCWRQPPALSLQ